MSKFHTYVAARHLSQTITGPSGALTILNQIELNIKHAESVAIIGASGSGKSTLLAMLAGLDTPSEGEIFLAGQQIVGLDEEARAEIRKHQVAFIFQNFQLLPSLTALENVMLPLEIKGERNAATQANNYLKRVGLELRGSHYPVQLSGGEQQRVAIARAFATQAPILFADEPTGNLDSQTGDIISELLFELNQAHQTTLILVTHDRALARRCERCLILDSGYLQADTRGSQYV
jgi:putative ABC transport system ATP-binding protein